MFRYDIKNPNGSLVFVRGVRVKPYAKFSANLDPSTARELTRYGVHLKQTGRIETVPELALPEPLKETEFQEPEVPDVSRNALQHLNEENSSSQTGSAVSVVDEESLDLSQQQEAEQHPVVDAPIDEESAAMEADSMEAVTPDDLELTSDAAEEPHEEFPAETSSTERHGVRRRKRNRR